jgi:perosamine synthetase
VHHDLGYNARMTNMQAAVGLAQLERIEEFISKKRKTGECYQQRLSGLPPIQLPLKETNYARNIYWVFGILINKDFPKDPKMVMKEGKVAIGYDSVIKAVKTSRPKMIVFANNLPQEKIEAIKHNAK